eukprot:2295952-Lingulodinium_polyedra.AAC.1
MPRPAPPASECEPATAADVPDVVPLRAGPPEMFAIHRRPVGQRWAWCSCAKYGGQRRYATAERR